MDVSYYKQLNQVLIPEKETNHRSFDTKTHNSSARGISGSWPGELHASLSPMLPCLKLF